VAAGPVANFILTFVLLAGILIVLGVPREEPTVGAIREMPTEGAWLQEGDVILAMNGNATPDSEAFGQVLGDLPSSATIEYRVQRGEDQVTVQGPHPFAPVVGQVMIRSAAMDAGLQAGDVILRAGGQAVTTFSELPEIVAASKGTPVPLTVWRRGETFDLTLSPRVRTVEDETGAFVERYQIGVVAGLCLRAREPVDWPVGDGDTVPWPDVADDDNHIFRPLAHDQRGDQQLQPFGRDRHGRDDGGRRAQRGGKLHRHDGVLSLGVGILNLFPIPVLDGGHLVFHAYEAIARRPPSERALRVLMSIGLTLVIGLMVFGLSRDLTCI
jgi:regulator of sigma E protease